MPTYEERLSELRKRKFNASPEEARKISGQEEKLFAEEVRNRPPTAEEGIWKRRFEEDPSLIRGAGYYGEATQEVPAGTEPLLTNIPEQVTRKRPTFFVGETPEEVSAATTAGAKKAILGRPRPGITFDKFGEPIIEKGVVSRVTGEPQRGIPSKEDLDLNEKWTDFRENYFVPKLGYDPRIINSVQEGIDTENGIMSQVNINSLSVDQYTKLKKEAEKRGKLAEEFAKEKIRVGKDKETQAFELFKTDMATVRKQEPKKMSFKDINDYLYKMTHGSDGSSYELSPADLMQLQQMAKQSGYTIKEDIVTPGETKPFWFDKAAEKGYFVKPLGGITPINQSQLQPNLKQGAVNNILKNIERMPQGEKQKYLQRGDVQAYAHKYGIRGQDLGF